MPTRKTVTPIRKVTGKKVTPVVQSKVKEEPTVELKTVVEEPVVEEPVVEEAHSDEHSEVEPKKRQRARQRPFEELFSEVHGHMEDAYKALQTSRKLLKQLENAHKRSVQSNKSRESTTRTPTILFDQPLVDYLKSRLDVNELKVTRRNNGVAEEVVLADLSPETHVYRTDVTQLLNAAFRKHNLLGPKDMRQIQYQLDEELVTLLTTGDYDPKYQSDVDAILNGTHTLTIFNIQRLTNQHMGKVELPKKVKKEEETTA